MELIEISDIKNQLICSIHNSSFDPVFIWQQLVEDGYATRTAQKLERVGYKAWLNAVGDIAIEPSAGALPTG